MSTTTTTLAPVATTAAPGCACRLGCCRDAGAVIAPDFAPTRVLECGIRGLRTHGLKDREDLEDLEDLEDRGDLVAQRGAAAARLVVALLAGETPDSRHILMPTRLVLRATSTSPQR